MDGSNSTPDSDIQIIFGDAEYEYRIPALLYLKKDTTGVFLAFAEKRISNKDENAKNLVRKIGELRPDNKVKWSDTQDLMKATKDGYRTMNPCPVFEKKTKTLYLFFICLKGDINEDELKKGQSRLCYITSTDYGKTWNDIQDITDVMDRKYCYQTFAVGPGHGIQLSTGHLLVPAYGKQISYKKSTSCCCCWGSSKQVSSKSQSLVLRSSDGKSWEACDLVSEESVECQLAEVSGKRVYLNARTTGKFRVEALSEDEGKHFKLRPPSNLEERENGCQGSVLGFTAGGSSETSLLFSHPTKAKGYEREDLGVYMRKSLQVDWGKAHIILTKSSGYSDLTAYDEERFGFACLMERKEEKRYQIIFKQFNVCQIGSAREDLECETVNL